MRALVLPRAAIVILGAALVAGCTAAVEPSGTPRFAVTRSWSTGYEESADIYADGRVVMHHGDNVERFALPAAQMLELDAAAAAPVAPGSNADDPIVGVTIGSSAPVRPARSEPGTLAELLGRLLDVHTLHP